MFFVETIFPEALKRAHQNFSFALPSRRNLVSCCETPVLMTFGSLLQAGRTAQQSTRLTTALGHPVLEVNLSYLMRMWGEVMGSVSRVSCEFPRESLSVVVVLRLINFGMRHTQKSMRIRARVDMAILGVNSLILQ